MSLTTLVLEKKDGVARITLNRPEKLNALNMTVLDDLEAAFGEVRRDPAVKVVVLTGTVGAGGRKTFSVGADITMFSPKPLDAVEISRRGQRVYSLVEDFEKPVLAMVGGFCLGGGCELAMSCDLIIASEDAEFGQPEINLGIIPGWGGTQRLPRRVGVGKALDLILTGRRVKAQEAERMGLADVVVPADKLEETTNAIASQLASKSSVALRLAKKVTKKALDLPLGEGLNDEAYTFGVLFSSEDAKEGIAAFQEKRQPVFKGS